MSKFDAIKVGSTFQADGVIYKKVGLREYEELSTHIEQYWDPLFDSKIDSPDEASKLGTKFKVDPQTRVVTADPAHKDPAYWFHELWGSALFDCGPDDYDFMVKKDIEWGKNAKQAAESGDEAEQPKA